MIYLQTFENFTNTKTYTFAYTCVNPGSLSELEDIIDNMKEITSTTFFKHVAYDNEVYDQSKKELLNDYHVSYYRCPKYDCYVLVHSGIEHVYKNTIDKIKKEKTKKEKTKKEKTSYKLLQTYNNYSVGDNIENFGKITKIFSYPDGQVQYEIDNKRYYNSSYFE